MAHIHSVYDSDKHFTIDPLTRELKNETPGKTGIMQHDHNSERITFDLPAVVEGHNTMNCNVVEVHYLNIDAQTKEEKVGLYEVDDLQLSPSSSDVAICSWLISQNATQLVGPLFFRLTFKCVTDTVDYVWSTAIYKGLSVSDGIDSAGWVEETYADILAQWEAKMIALERETRTIDWDDVQNKPFGDEVADEIILEETIVTTTPAMEEGRAYGPLELGEIIPGHKYVVSISGDKYTRFADVAEGIGNRYLCDYHSENTGEPFYLDGGQLWTEMPGPYVIKVTHRTGTGLKQLDEKYIPDTIARTEDIPKTAADVGAVATTGKGHIKHDQAEVFTLEDTGASASVYMSLRAQGGYRATMGYHNDLAYIANEKAGGARIGVNNQKEPVFRTGTQVSTEQKLLHTGNYIYTASPLPFAEITGAKKPADGNAWACSYVYPKGYVKHIKTRLFEGSEYENVPVKAYIFRASDMMILRICTTTGNPGEVIIPVEGYIGFDFHIAFVCAGIDFKSGKYSALGVSFLSDKAKFSGLGEGDIIIAPFRDMTEDPTTYILAQEVTYDRRYTAEPHTFTHKRMFAAGDSITAGHNQYTEGIHWWETVGRNLGYDVTMGAKSGSGFSYFTTPGSQNACTMARDNDFKVYDVAVFAFGTNDYGNDMTMGTIDDAPGYKTDNTGTFYAAVKYVVETVLTSNPTCMLIFALPINRSTHGTREDNWAFGTVNSAGHTLSEYCDAIIAVCDKYGIPYIDRRHSIVNAYTVQHLTYDNLHPTDEGYKLLGMELSARIGALIRPYPEYKGTT